MTDKFINVSIFWLPLVAGIILGGMSPSVWYGGDKLSALWMTFAGVVMLLLTATFQIQSYIQENVLQPQFTVSKPEQKYLLTWNPPTDNSLNIRGENDNLPPNGWRVPIFQIKNETPINAQDVKIKWSATKYDPPSLATNKPIFQNRHIDFVNGMAMLWAENSVPFGHQLSFSQTIEKPFITRTAEIFIPIDVWNTAALFFLSTMDQQAGSRSDPYYFDLEISWNIPDKAKPARYKVKAVATNVSPTNGPVFRASVDFSVEKID